MLNTFNLLNFSIPIRVFVIFLLCMSLCSCKESTRNNESSQKPIEGNSSTQTNSIGPANFSLTLEVLMEKDDHLQLFYIQESTENYSVDQMLTQDVKGSSKFQSIIFDMPSEFYPFNLRIDLGTNPEQSVIKINKCTLKYGDKKVDIKANEFKDYFFFNQGVEMTSDPTSFKLKTFKEGASNKYDPFLMGNQKLNTTLLKNL